MSSQPTFPAIRAVVVRQIEVQKAAISLLEQHLNSLDVLDDMSDMMVCSEMLTIRKGRLNTLETEFSQLTTFIFNNQQL